MKYHSRIKLAKIEELEDAEHPNNIATGKEYEGVLENLPKVGYCFYMQYDLDKDLFFRSSIVTEVIDENTFRTLNSIYTIKEII